MGKTIRDHAAEAGSTKEAATSEVLHSCGMQLSQNMWTQDAAASV